MAELNGYLERLGILSPAQRQAQFRDQMQQHIQNSQVQQRTNLGVGEMSEGFGFPGYMIAQANSGFPGQEALQVPVPQQADPREADITGMLMGGGGPAPMGGTPGINPNAPDPRIPPMLARNPQQQQQAPQPQQQAGPMSARLHQVSQYLLQSGDRHGALTMKVEALKAEQNEVEEARKAEAESRAQAEERRKQAQASNPGAVETLMTGGESRAQFREIKDKDGRVIGREKVGEGQVGGGTNIDFDGLASLLTKGDRSKAVVDFSAKLEGAKNFLDTADSINERIDSGAKTGWAASAVTVLDNAVGGLKSLARSAEIKNEATDYVDSMWNTSKWQKLATDTAISKSQYTELVFALAASQNQGGAITKKDVTQAEEQLGMSLADPGRAKSVLNDVAKRLGYKMQNSFDYLPDADVRKDVGPLLEQFKKSHSEFMSLHSPKPATAAGADDAEYQAWKLSKGLK